jgi:hypothetical protein
LAAGLGVLAVVLSLTLITLLLLFLARVFLRKQWLALGLTGLILAILNLGATGENFWVALPFAILFVALSLIVLIRFGLLALFVFNAYYLLMSVLPVTLDFSRWYIGRSLFFLLFLIGLAVYGFRAALAGRAAFNIAGLED